MPAEDITWSRPSMGASVEAAKDWRTAVDAISKAVRVRMVTLTAAGVIGRAREMQKVVGKESYISIGSLGWPPPQVEL